MSFDKEIYLKALNKKKEYKEALEMIDAVITQQEEFLDQQFDDSLEPNSLEITDTLERVKKISKKVNAEAFYKDMEEEVGTSVHEAAIEAATTTRTSLNRTNYSKEIMKVLGPEYTEKIKAVEENNSEKTIKFETVDVSE